MPRFRRSCASSGDETPSAASASGVARRRRVQGWGFTASRVSGVAIGTRRALAILDSPVLRPYPSRRSRPAAARRDRPMMELLLQLLPPWMVIAPLIGLINASLFFVIIGRRSI